MLLMYQAAVDKWQVWHCVSDARAFIDVIKRGSN